jgi:hypothetical protein
MNLPEQMAKHLRDVHGGGNWTVSNMKEQLADITWQQATTKVHSLNTIAVLVFHINYFVAAALRVLQGQAINAHDKYSFDLPPIKSEEDWQRLLDKTWKDAENLVRLVEQLPAEKLGEDFVEKKYGNYYRNIAGIIEHTHYHLGQIALIKKIVQQPEKPALVSGP